MQPALCAYLCVLGCLCVPSQQLVHAVGLCVGGVGQWGWCACPDSSAAFLVHAELPVAVSPSLMRSHMGIAGQGTVFAQQNPNETGTS